MPIRAGYSLPHISTDIQGDLAALQQLLLTHLDGEEQQVMPAMMPWWFTHIDAADRVCVAQNMTVGVPADFLPILSQWIASGLDETQWNELVGQVPALATTA